MAGFALVAHWLACIWYAIANAERPGLSNRIGWLDQLANTTLQPFHDQVDEKGRIINSTGGPPLIDRLAILIFVESLHKLYHKVPAVELDVHKTDLW